MNLEEYKTILASNIQENATRLITRRLILHQDNDQFSQVYKGKEMESLRLPKSQ